MAKNKGINWDSQPLGEMPDRALSRQLGVSPASVYIARVKRNILTYSDDTNKGINWDSQPLGEMSDRALSRQLGVSQSAVIKARVKRNIPVYHKPCAICGTPIIPIAETQFNMCNLCHKITNDNTALSDMDVISITEKKAKLLAKTTPERLEKYRAKRRKDNE